MNRLRYALAKWLIGQWSLSTLKRRPDWLGHIAMRLSFRLWNETWVAERYDINGHPLNEG